MNQLDADFSAFIVYCPGKGFHFSGKIVSINAHLTWQLFALLSDKAIPAYNQTNPTLGEVTVIIGQSARGTAFGVAHPLPGG
jgi:hypothetical protein